LQKNVHFDLSILVSCFGIVNVTFAIEIGDDNDAFFVEVVIEEPTSSIREGWNIIGDIYRGDSSIRKLPTANKVPMATCIIKGSRQAQSLSM
jgi:hypothetical protein